MARRPFSSVLALVAAMLALPWSLPAAGADFAQSALVDEVARTYSALCPQASGFSRVRDDFVPYEAGRLVGGAEAWEACENGDLLAVLASPNARPTATVELIVPAGTVFQVALPDEVRVKKEGQEVQGFLAEPVFAFDQEVIPAGSEVRGRIVEIEGVSRKRRFFAALSFNFSPPRKVHLDFDEVILPDGLRIPVETEVTPGSGRPLQLITTTTGQSKRTIKDVAVQKMREQVREAKRQWDEAMAQVTTPGRMDRLGRLALEQLPVRPQYVDAGTVYFAELLEPLSFGVKVFNPGLPAGDEAPLPSCSLLAHAQLLTPLSSATTVKDTPVEAILTRPLFAGERLLFPQGTLLRGTVVVAQPARSFKRNGELRMEFKEIALPGGLGQEIITSIEGVQAGQEENVRLDLEGGTRAANSRRRFVLTGLAVGLAAASHQDSDVEDGVSSSAQGGVREGVSGGAAAFKLAGAVAGAVVRSQSFSLWMGLFGAGRSVYSNFLSRGREVTFPKGTAMEIGLWLTENCTDSVPPEGDEKSSKAEKNPQGETP